MICELLQNKWNLVLSTRPFALKGQFGEFVVIIDCVVVGVDVALVVVFVDVRLLHRTEHPPDDRTLSSHSRHRKVYESHCYSSAGYLAMVAGAAGL